MAGRAPFSSCQASISAWSMCMSRFVSTSGKISASRARTWKQEHRKKLIPLDKS